MGGCGFSSLLYVPVAPSLWQLKTAQGRLEGKHLGNQENLAIYANKTRLKTASLFVVIALGFLLTSFSFLRGAYLLSKAVYLKTNPSFLAAHIAFAFLGIGIVISSQVLIVRIIVKAKNQERSSRQSRV